MCDIDHRWPAKPKIFVCDSLQKKFDGLWFIYGDPFMTDLWDWAKRVYLKYQRLLSHYNFT